MSERPDALRPLLSGPSAVHALPAGTTADEVAAAARALGLDFMHLDAAGAATPEELFHRAHVALALPDYFGNNWDALLDVLRDLRWRPPRGHVLLCTGLATLERAAPGELAKARLVFDEAARFWHERIKDAPPLYVLIG